MSKKRESSEVVKDRILKVATELFAKYGVDGVGIRRIADEAGINHAMIIRYFGNKDELMAEILRREIAKLAITYPVKSGQIPARALAVLREALLSTLNTDENTMKLIVRSELDGLAPESYVDADHERAASTIAKWIESKQTGENLPDAKLVSVILTGALFSFVSIAPWLMTAVGFPAEDFEKHKEDLMDVLIWITAKATGLPPDAGVNR